MKTSADRIFVVLGMHRSGTSVLTRALNVLGVELGSNLHPPRYDNPKGFWEDRDVWEINEALLAMRQSSYDRLMLPSDQWHFSPEKGRLAQRAVNLLREKLSASGGIWGFKDPRTARLLDFWLDVFSTVGCEIYFLIAVRNPCSVVDSLLKRDHIFEQKSYWLWIQHTLPALVQTHGARRVIVDYDLFMCSPSQQLNRIANALDLDSKTDNSENFNYFNSVFLDETLRHTVFSERDLKFDKRAPPIAHDLYRLCLSLACDEPPLDEDLQSRLSQFSEFCYLNESLIAIINNVEDQRNNLAKELLLRNRDLEVLRAAVVNKDDRPLKSNADPSDPDAQMLSCGKKR